MIKLVDSLEDFSVCSAEQFKIKTNYNLYKTDAMFWKSSKGGIISSLDNNAVLYGDFDTEELNEFLSMLSFGSVFCSLSLAEKINLPYKRETVAVLERNGKITGDYHDGDCLKSDEVYSLLDVKGLSLPDMQSFSVDFCRRLNNNALCYYAERGNGVAVCFLLDGTALINGIASRKKGFGTKALFSVMKKADKGTVFAVSRKDTVQFYTKNGFYEKYNAVYMYRIKEEEK